MLKIFSLMLFAATMLVVAPSEAHSQTTEWWGPFKAESTDKSSIVAQKQASAKAKAGMNTIKANLPKDWILVGYRVDNWSLKDNKNGTWTFKMSWSVKILKLDPIQPYPFPMPWPFGVPIP